MAKVVLVTGAGKRIGLALIEHFHEKGLRVFVHTHAAADCEALVQRLNSQREHSANGFACDLTQSGQCEELVAACIAAFGRLDLLVNSASFFIPQALGSVTAQASLDQLHLNLVCPLLLAQAAAPHLTVAHGSIVNLTDVKANNQPLKGYCLYTASKAGLEGLTRALAVELAPQVRVNAVALSVVGWPQDWSENDPRKAEILHRIPLARTATTAEVAAAVEFLGLESQFATGTVVNIDGGAAIA